MSSLFFDLLALMGLGMLAFGLWLFSPPVMFVVIGTIFIATALVASWRGVDLNFTRPKQDKHD